MNDCRIPTAVLGIWITILLGCKSDAVRAHAMLDQAGELAQENKMNARKILSQVASGYADIQEGAEAKHLLDVLQANQSQKQDSNSLRHELSAQVGRFALDYGRYPTLQEGLKALLVDPGVTGWKGPYLDHSWTARIQGFEYTLPDGRPEILLHQR